MPITDTKAREFRRQLFGGASDAVPDKQGRVHLPPYLREYANLDSQAVVVGLYDHCEIWNPERWIIHLRKTEKNLSFQQKAL